MPMQIKMTEMYDLKFSTTGRRVPQEVQRKYKMLHQTPLLKDLDFREKYVPVVPRLSSGDLTRNTPPVAGIHTVSVCRPGSTPRSSCSCTTTHSCWLPRCVVVRVLVTAGEWSFRGLLDAWLLTPTRWWLGPGHHGLLATARDQASGA